jgi:hypothetical protein
MKQEDSQTPAQKIAAEADFRPYLEAVIAASQRTRFTIYVLIAALLIIITTFRNTDYPDWVNSRLMRLQIADACLQDNNQSDDCAKAVDYAKEFMAGDSGAEEMRKLYFDKGLGPGLDLQIEELIKQRTQALTIHLPFFGLAIDINDLGLAGGLFLAPILFVLYASLGSEMDNVKRAERKARKIKDEGMRDDNLELLLMAQLLASPSKGNTGVSKGIYVLLLLVAAFHLYVCFDDLRTLPIAINLEGWGVAIVETVIEWVAFTLVLLLSVLCMRRYRELNKSLREIAVPI